MEKPSETVKQMAQTVYDDLLKTHPSLPAGLILGGLDFAGLSRPHAAKVAAWVCDPWHSCPNWLPPHARTPEVITEVLMKIRQRARSVQT